MVLYFVLGFIAALLFDALRVTQVNHVWAKEYDRMCDEWYATARQSINKMAERCNTCPHRIGGTADDT